MKYLITIIVLVATLYTGIVQAGDRIPFGNQVHTVQNYNRLTPQIASSGMIGDGGATLLAAHNFKTVIDMRSATEGTQEEKVLVEAANMTYINIPTSVAGFDDEQLAAFTEAIENAEKPILVHCGSGNRAGGMWASYQISKGVDPEKALQEGRKAGMRPPLEAKVSCHLLNVC